MGRNQWYHVGAGAPPILEPILVVGLGCSLGVRAFDPWPVIRAVASWQAGRYMYEVKIIEALNPVESTQGIHGRTPQPRREQRPVAPAFF